MNILISAYACEPNKGSEPGVGWNWAIELSKHHNVWVITRDNNKSTIESYIKENPSYNCKNLKFIYVGLFRAIPAAYGGSQARSLIRATAAALRQSHSNARSEQCQQPTPQLMATPYS